MGQTSISSKSCEIAIPALSRRAIGTLAGGVCGGQLTPEILYGNRTCGSVCKMRDEIEDHCALNNMEGTVMRKRAILVAACFLSMGCEGAKKPASSAASAANGEP